MNNNNFKWYSITLENWKHKKLKRFLDTLAVYSEPSEFYDLIHVSIKIDPNSFEFNLITQYIDALDYHNDLMLE